MGTLQGSFRPLTFQSFRNTHRVSDHRVITCVLTHALPGDVPFLPSVARSGLTLEVGAVAHSTATAKVMSQMLSTIKQIVNFLELRNSVIDEKRDSPNGDQAKRTKTFVEKSVQLSVARRSGYVDFPRDREGNLNGFIHSSLQGIQELADESRLVEGQPLFVAADGETVVETFQAAKAGLTADDVKAGVFPMFVNEAAYYEKGIAMMLTRVEHVGPFGVYVEA
jgi:succinylglutamate desuccinylase